MAAQVRAYFRNVLNIDPHLQGANSPTREALINHGLDDIDTFHLLDSTDVDRILKAVTTPPGYVVDPNHVGPGPAPMVRDRGVPINAGTQQNIHKAVWCRRHQHKIQRDWNNPNMATLNQAWELKQMCADHDNNIALPPKISNTRNMRQTMEDLDAYLTQKLGGGNIPLMYVVCPVVAVPGYPRRN